MLTKMLTTLGLSLTLATAALAADKSPVDLKKVTAHLEKHQHYPASKAQLTAACGGLADFSAEEKKWLTERLEDRTYASATEVLAALKKK